MRAVAARHRWATAVGALLTVVMVAGLARALLGDGLAGLGRSAPANPLFYLAFAAAYLALPVGDWLIFRRLWDVPASGLAATIKKRIANEVVLGYTGEAYFYAWARARARAAAPFGAVKDVSILSAVAGNAVTLAAAVAAAPAALALLPPATLRLAAAGGAALVATTLPFLLFRRRVFSLPPAELRWILGVHAARQILSTALVALCWALGVPGVSAGLWLLLAAGRLAVSRLPLVPNKELLFANLALLLIGGSAGAVAGLVAFTAALTLATHAALVAAFAAHALWMRRRR